MGELGGLLVFSEAHLRPTSGPLRVSLGRTRTLQVQAGLHQRLLSHHSIVLILPRVHRSGVPRSVQCAFRSRFSSVSATLLQARRGMGDPGIEEQQVRKARDGCTVVMCRGMPRVSNC